MQLAGRKSDVAWDADSRLIGAARRGWLWQGTAQEGVKFLPLLYSSLRERGSDEANLAMLLYLSDDRRVDSPPSAPEDLVLLGLQDAVAARRVGGAQQQDDNTLISLQFI